MASKRDPKAVQRDGGASALAQLVAVEAALSGIASMPIGGLTAVESAQAEGLRQAAGRLVEVAEQIQAEGLSVEGSMKQLRAHPLLGEERALRREIADRLVKLEYRVGQRKLMERLNDLTRDPVQPAEPEEEASSGARDRPRRRNAETCKPEGLQASTN